ncbi:EPL1 domain-containing protein [Cephalotus follicularis]|uniref:Enhancer of polycomb-like protein n=1 Tax=Cephalotus follicularis TaxID=3775 RepID=A0A1Q3DAL5_CEPFO|nr:EPL1 domain-containing protein [Cephalotus follicularis]
MENRIGNSHGVEIPRKSRSLDLKSLYKSKASMESQFESLKRKASVEVGDNDDEKLNKKKKSKKSISLNNLQNGDSNSGRPSDNGGGLSSGSHDSKDLNLRFSQNLSHGQRLSGILHSLDDGGVQIPRRKRDFVGRKKFESIHVLKPVGQLSSKVGVVDQAGKVVSKPVGQLSSKVDVVDQVGKVVGDSLSTTGESLKVNWIKGFDDLKENRNGKSNSAEHLKEEGGHGNHIVLNNGEFPLKKSRKNRNKKNVIAPVSAIVAKETEPLVDSPIQICDRLREDDEENLEENAARMLSSRFDPSCTGFSSNSKASSPPSSNGLSFLFSGRHFVTRGSKPFGSESASVDTASRVLRPRDQHKRKGNSRKRRHYYEIFYGDLDPYLALKKRIKVFWPLDQSWYYGLVNDYDKETKLHHVKYDDRDEEWINLQQERFKLLLLPSEAPSKAQRRRSRMREKRSDEGKRNLKSSEGKEKRNSTIEDDSYMGSTMDSVPIISWLGQSTRLVKSSPFRAMKKQKTAGLSSSTVSDEPCLDGCSLKREKSKLSSNSVLPFRLAYAGGCEESTSEIPTCLDSKPPIVYVRKRFRQTKEVFCHTSEADNVTRAEFEPVTSLASFVNGFVNWEKHENFLGNFDPDGELWSIHDEGSLKLSIPLRGSRQFRFYISFPVLSILKCSFGAENVWLLQAALLLRYGTMMTVWPRVHLEMLFVDNIDGLRFLLFEGCLKQAVALIFMVLTIFHQPNEQWKYADLQLPVTSIRFKLSCIQGFKKQLVFAFYNFSKVKSSKWTYLDSKLVGHCSIIRQLPLSECSYDNINALQNGSNKLPISSICLDSSGAKGLHRRSRQGISLMAISRESTCVRLGHFSANSDKQINFPPLVLSFTAAPTFFLSLHLKLLMEHSVAHISFRDHDPAEHPGNSDCFIADDCSSMGDISYKGSVCTLENNFKALAGDAAQDECFSCAKSKLGTVRPSMCSNGSWIESSQKCQNGDLNVAGTTVNDVVGIQSVVPVHKWQGHDSELEAYLSLPKPLVDQDKTGSESPPPFNCITVEIPSFDQFEKHTDRESNGVQQSADLSWNMSGGIIPSPNPTAPRSTWHRNRSNSSSFGYLGHGWSDGKADLFHNNFSNGPKKPRTQVSYTLPFGGLDCSPKNKNQHQKGIMHNKRIRRASEKRLPDVSRRSQRNLELLSCDANVLITLGDRGWRESGAQIVLELVDHNEWKLAIKLSGTTKYSYKAHQFMLPGSTNRFTHAMMWKGGKDWSLEFPDRSQWALFKEMHQECYDRNIRAASVKNIPIPGVRLIEENDDIGTEPAFVRSSSKYFRQVETDVQMALDPLHVLYDMDSDDEKWILRMCSSSEVDESSSWEISDELFEKTMDMFEKAAYVRQCDQLTSDEIEQIMAGVGPMDVIKIIYKHWQQKRQKKGMPLIRHLQLPLWERYQQEVKEWEQGMSKIPNGSQEKVLPVEKPPMFAFCLKPRGLEVSNRGSKQRSQRRFSVSGQSNPFLDHDGFHTLGRRSNGYAYGDEKVVYPVHNYDIFYDSSLPQTSPQDAIGMGHFSLSSDAFERNNLYKPQRSRPKKFGTSLRAHDEQMVASCSHKLMGKRNGIHFWNMGSSEWPNQQQQYRLDGSPWHGLDHLNGSDLDEFRLRDASSAAQHKLNVAKLKREKAQRLFYRADLAIHKAVVALMNAEAIKASSEDLIGDGQLTNGYMR